MPTRILFVCTGNTCRSSMAEALARDLLRQLAANEKSLPLAVEEISVMSAGLSAWPGNPASPQAVEVLRSQGIDLSCHRARLVDEELLEKSDYILTMTIGHKLAITGRYPRFAEKVFTLAEFATGEPDRDILDPFGQAVSRYEECAAEIKVLVEKALKKAAIENNQ